MHRVVNIILPVIFQFEIIEGWRSIVSGEICRIIVRNHKRDFSERK